MRLAEQLRRMQQSEMKAFIAYVTAGDPNLAATGNYVRALAAAGADVIELGVPFSDPLADGPTNQAAAERALISGTNLSGILAAVRQWRDDGLTVPLLLFSYLNPLLKYGLVDLAVDCRKAGIDGILAVDLPPEEADFFLAPLRAAEVETVFLAAPTTRRERLQSIEQASSAFVYYVSRTGVTGAKADLSQSLHSELAKVRQAISKPLMVGFGVSTPQQAQEIAKAADGVVVGSALVEIIAKAGPDIATGLKELGKLAEALASAIHLAK